MAKNYEDLVHLRGRIWTIVALILMLSIPSVISITLDLPPDWKAVMTGVGMLAVMMLPGAVIEVLTYAPLLGSGATYLAFVTGNLSNLKIPCAMNAKELAGTEFGTPENEVVATLSVASSTIVTTLVVSTGVLMLAPLTPFLENPLLQPAFRTVIYALFGALGYKYFMAHPKIAVLPLTVTVGLCLLFPAAAHNISLLILGSATVSIVFAFILFKKNLI